MRLFISTNITKFKNAWRYGWVYYPYSMFMIPTAIIVYAVETFFYARAEHVPISTKYKHNIMIMRPDNPKVQKIKHFSYLDT